MRSGPVLVTGGTGYVGGRLVPQLLNSGYRVRAAVRSLTKVKSRLWSEHPTLEIVRADALDSESMLKAAQGCRAAFYLVHSMNPRNRDFAEADRRAARNMAKAAEKSSLEQIIYLGGLGIEGSHLSRHLRSRAEVAEILKAGSVPTTFLRAAMILGSGSASFEIFRYLVERLPVMITPRWVHNPVQPIAIRNVLNYLQGCLERDETLGQTFDIGGPDVLTYRALMEIYAQEAGLKKRLIIPVPMLTPRLSSYWIHLVTPVPSFIARPLAEGLSNPVVCQENRIQSIIPQELLSCRKTIRIALDRFKQQAGFPCRKHALTPTVPEWVQSGDAPYAGGTVLECHYRAVINAIPEKIWKPLAGIEKTSGCFFSLHFRAARRVLERPIRQIFFRRQERGPKRTFSENNQDSWEILESDEPRRLLLKPGMKSPGESVVEFRLYPQAYEKTELQRLLFFLPRGLFGIVYWYFLCPFQKSFFKFTLRRVEKGSGAAVSLGPQKFNPANRRGICSDDRMIKPSPKSS